MSELLTLRLCLEPPLLQSAQAGEHNFINLILDVVQQAGFAVEFLPAEAADLSAAHDTDTYTLSHMRQPRGPRSLIFRRVYHYPFWQIDQVAARWNWDVAQAHFDPNSVPEQEAQRFAGFWRKRLFGPSAQQAVRAGYIYVPLQGMLQRHRSFQSCSPIDMISATLSHANGRKIVLGLHPKEQYSPADMNALAHLVDSNPALSLVQGEMVDHLQHCDFVVTQNSSVAFNGFFFGKPALLFAQIDFHHIAIKAEMPDLKSCFEQVADHTADYAAYLWWFWQQNSINAGRPEARDKIATRLARFGWPINKERPERAP